MPGEGRFRVRSTARLIVDREIPGSSTSSLERDLLLRTAEEHVSVSEAIRRAIGQYLRHRASAPGVERKPSTSESSAVVDEPARPRRGCPGGTPGACPGGAPLWRLPAARAPRRSRPRVALFASRCHPCRHHCQRPAKATACEAARAGRWRSWSIQEPNARRMAACACSFTAPSTPLSSQAELLDALEQVDHRALGHLGHLGVAPLARALHAAPAASRRARGGLAPTSSAHWHLVLVARRVDGSSILLSGRRTAWDAAFSDWSRPP